MTAMPPRPRARTRLAGRNLIELNRPATNRREVRVGITRQRGHLTRAQLGERTALLRAARLPHESADCSWR